MMYRLTHIGLLVGFCLTTISGCSLLPSSDPLEEVERLDEVTLAAPTTSITASPEEPGLLARFFPVPPAPEEIEIRNALATAIGQPTVPDTPEPQSFFAGLFSRDDSVAPVEDNDTFASSVDDVDPATTAPILAQADLSDDKPGFFASLFSTKQAEVPDLAPEQTALGMAEGQASVPEPAKAGFFVGLSGFFGQNESGNDSVSDDIVPPLSDLAFGQLGRTCGLASSDLGAQVISTSGFSVYDTFPNSTAPRPHYISGFSDGCVRQFTAALVLSGDVGTHELVRYARTRVDLPYSATDQAYEEIKGRFCGVGEGEPCGARLERLGAGTTFITAYETFGDSPDWAEFLLHNGAVAAVAIEGL